MKQIAHRGYTNKYIKENTLEAFDNAIENGFAGFECDVRSTKDNIAVICHDPFIDRTSNGTGLIKTYTYKELLHLNFGTNKIPSKIPTLKKVLRSYNCLKIIELKVDINLTKIIRYVDDKTYFISFNPQIIKKVKRDYPYLKAGLLTSYVHDKRKYNYDLICLLDNFSTEKILKYFSAKEIVIFIYGIVGKLNVKSNSVYYITGKKIKEVIN